MNKTSFMNSIDFLNKYPAVECKELLSVYFEGDKE